MARSLNKVMLIGFCASEPELRAQQATYKIVSITVATTERRSNGQGGYTESTEWHRISLWNTLADFALNYIHKGSRVYVEGRLRQNNYQDKTHPDITHRSYEIVADQLISLDRRQDEAQGAYQDNAPVRPNGGWSGTNDNNNAPSFGAPNNFGQAPANFGQPQPQLQPQPQPNPFTSQPMSQPMSTPNQGFSSFAQQAAPAPIPPMNGYQGANFQASGTQNNTPFNQNQNAQQTPSVINTQDDVPF